MQEIFEDKDGERGGSVTDFINGLVDLLSLKTQVVWHAMQEGFDLVELWDKE